MRKRLKRKKRCCHLCKGYKRGQHLRWTDRDHQLLKEFERESRSYERY
jgi:hypothetical protein